MSSGAEAALHRCVFTAAALRSKPGRRWRIPPQMREDAADELRQDLIRCTSRKSSRRPSRQDVASSTPTLSSRSSGCRPVTTRARRRRKPGAARRGAGRRRGAHRRHAGAAAARRAVAWPGALCRARCTGSRRWPRGGRTRSVPATATWSRCGRQASADPRARTSGERRRRGRTRSACSSRWR